MFMIDRLKKLSVIATLSLFILLLGATAHAQTPIPNAPPQFARALQALGQYLNRPITPIDLTRWDFVLQETTSTALNCPLLPGQPLPSPVQVYVFTIVIGSTSYDVRVSSDTSIAFACMPPLANVPPTATTLPGVTPAATTGPVTPSPCPLNFAGLLPPRLNIGADGRVPAGNTPNRIREAPSTSAAQVGLINPNTTARVIGGPSCDLTAGIIWWQITYNGVTGWTAEGVLPDDYFIDPVGTVTPPTAGGIPVDDAGVLPTERTAITAQNAFNLTMLAALPITGVAQLTFDRTSGRLAVIAGGVPQLFTLPDLAIDEVIGSTAGTPPATHIAFSADQLVAAFANASLGRYDLTTGALTMIGTPLSGIINDIDTSLTPPFDNGSVYPGNRVAVATGSAAGQNNVFIIDLTTGRTLVRVDSPAPVRAVAYSIDGTNLAYMDSALHVIDVAQNQEFLNTALTAPVWGALAWRPFPLGQAEPQAFTFGTGSAIGAFDLEANAQVTFEIEDGLFARALDYSADRTLLAALLTEDTPATLAGTPNRLALFDAETGDVLFQIDADGLIALDLSSDGTLLAVSDGAEVTLWGIR